MQDESKKMLPILFGIGLLFVAGLAIAIYVIVQSQGIVKNRPSEMDKAVELLAGDSRTTVRQNPVAVQWTDASRQPVSRGDIMVKVLSAVIGKVQVVSANGEAWTRDPALAITVSLENNGKIRTVDYTSWSLGAAKNEAPELKDDLARGYRMKSKTAFKNYSVQGQLSKTSVAPGGKIQDVLVFASPDANAKVKFLRLSLPASAFGEKGTLNFEVPIAMISNGFESLAPQANRGAPQGPPQSVNDPAKIFDLQGTFLHGKPTNEAGEFVEDVDEAGVKIQRQRDRVNDPNARPAAVPEPPPTPAPEKKKTDPSKLNPAEKLFEKPAV
jgi:hypothetical protein